MKSNDLSLENIHVGDMVSFDHAFTEDEVNTFAKLSGDENPLHVDEKYALQTKFKHRIVHGMLVGSLCSRFVGMYIPGKRCLYVSQNLFFKNPVYIADTLVVTGEVKSKSVSTGILEIFISIKNGEIEVLNGTAHVQVM